MNLIDVHQQFKSEDDCLAYLESQRWPQGVRCVVCESERISKFDSPGKTGKMRHLYECMYCGTQFTAKSGTIFHDSHLPLTKWFLAIALICQSKKGISANQLSRSLGVQYKTAWYLAHRIRKAMEEGFLERPLLSGVVELDETYIGGKQKGKGVWYGKKHKETVVGVRQRGGDLRLVHTPDAKANTLRTVLDNHVSPDVEMVMTDTSSAAYSVLRMTGKHRTINHTNGEYVNGIVHTNTIESAFSLLKRGVIGTYHRLSKKHLGRYLNEFTYRFNRREHEPEMFAGVLRDMTKQGAMQYKNLIA